MKARVSKSPASRRPSFDAEGCKRLTEKVIASLPEGSEQVKILSEELNPLQIDGKQTYLVELSYVYYGERFACYSLFLDRAPEMLIFVSIAGNRITRRYARNSIAASIAGKISRQQPKSERLRTPSPAAGAGWSRRRWLVSARRRVTASASVAS